MLRRIIGAASAGLLLLFCPAGCRPSSSPSSSETGVTVPAVSTPAPPTAATQDWIVARGTLPDPPEPVPGTIPAASPYEKALPPPAGGDLMVDDQLGFGFRSVGYSGDLSLRGLLDSRGKVVLEAQWGGFLVLGPDRIIAYKQADVNAGAQNVVDSRLFLSRCAIVDSSGRVLCEPVFHSLWFPLDDAGEYGPLGVGAIYHEDRAECFLIDQDGRQVSPYVWPIIQRDEQGYLAGLLKGWRFTFSVDGGIESVTPHGGEISIRWTPAADETHTFLLFDPDASGELRRQVERLMSAGTAATDAARKAGLPLFRLTFPDETVYTVYDNWVIERQDQSQTAVRAQTNPAAAIGQWLRDNEEALYDPGQVPDAEVPASSGEED